MGRLPLLLPAVPRGWGKLAPALWGTGGGGRLDPTLRSQGTSGSVLTPLLARWVPFLPLVTSNRLSSPGTTVSHQSPTTGSAPRGPPCPTGAVFPLPGGNHQVIVFQAPLDTGTRYIHAPASVRRHAPAAGVTHTASPKISRWGEGARKAHPKSNRGAGAATAAMRLSHGGAHGGQAGRLAPHQTPRLLI